MTKKMLLAALAVVMMAGTAFAAELPPREWWRNQAIAQRLNLNEDQQAKLDDIFRKAANELIDMRADAEKLSVALHGELDQPQLNRANLQKLASRLNDAHGKLFEREMMMLVDMRAVLTEDQWAKLREIVNRQGMRRTRPRPQ